MKKSLIILLFMVLFSFIFVKNVDAKTCSYNTVYVVYKSNSHTDYSVCEKNINVYGRACEIHDKGQLLNATITLDFDNDKLNISFLTRKDTDGNIGDMKTLEKVDVANSATASYFHFANKCPKAILVRTGVNGWASVGESKGYYLNDIDEAKNDIKNYITNGTWNNQSFFFVGERVTSDSEEEIDETHSSCREFTTKYAEKDKTTGKTILGCEDNNEFSCVWVDKKANGENWSYCNFDELRYVSCGSVMDLPTRLPTITSLIVNLLKIATPIILIFVSVISLIKAIASSKEDDIKKAQNTLIKRLIAAALVFFVIQITQFVILKVSSSADHNDMRACFSCLLNNDCQKNLYYKTQDAHANVDGKRYMCTYQNDPDNPIPCF